MQIKTAFDSSYLLGALVAAFSSNLVAKYEGVDITFEISVSPHSAERDNVRLAGKCLTDLGISHSFISFPKGDGRRYVSGISKSKLYFLDRPRATFVWLDSDTLVLSGLRDLEEKLKSDEAIYVVPTDENLEKFNSGVFAVTNFRKDFEWNEFETSDFFSDQHTLQQAFRGKSTALDSGFNSLSPWGLGLSVMERENRKAKILHYVGEIKPWHINPHHAKRCIENRCSFGQWFEMEEKLMRSLSLESRLEYKKIRKRASLYGPQHTRKITSLLIFVQSGRLGEFLLTPLAISIRVAKTLFPKIGLLEIHPYH